MMQMNIPERYLRIVIPIIESFSNDTTEFDRIHFRSQLMPYMPYIICVYLLILVGGAIGHCVLIRELIKRRKQLPRCHHYLIDLMLGNSLNDIFIKCAFVLPVSFLILTSVHWTLGQFACATFPLLQDGCFNATSLTFLSAFYVRYKKLASANFAGISLQV